ncbi:MAG: histidine kinase, partial [Bacteroidia bacterium]|nr:histidine kinase [Bacteroidia bacterium]
KQNHIPAIKRYAEKGLKLGEELDDHFAIMASKQGLAIYYLYEKKYDIAERYASEALELSGQKQFNESKAIILLTLSNISFAANNIAKGYYYQDESRSISDSIFTESIAKKDAELRVEYETEKKETQIKLQQAQLKQKNTLNSILIGGTAALLVISLLGFRNYKNKQRIQQQRITELETEKKLTATEAIIKGEEQERSRMAKDLHDGLGGMLSGIKHSLSHMKENLIMTPENALAFEHSLTMLDSSISEMRRVAHNMMPESLSKFGLDAAVKDFCHQVSLSGIIRVSYQSIGLAGKDIGQSLSITIYRIVQELLNNSVKHASAKQAMIQIALEGTQLTVTVEDDGQGFDVGQLKSATGIGWKNISSRLSYHNGKLDVQSSREKGTSVYIEFTI